MAELDVLSRGDATGGEWLNALRAFSDKYGGASSFDWDRQVKHVAVANVWSQLQKQTTTSGEDPLLSLTVVKILMRGRDSIDVFLSVEAFELFIRVAEQATDEAAACEAIKCAINSVYKRPSFVADLLATQTTYDTLFHLTSLARPFAWHTLVWKCLLATFEHPAAIERVEHTLHGYACILPTLAFCVQCPHSLPHDGDRVALATELLKVLYVFASAWQNAMCLPPAIESIADPAMALLSNVLALPNSQSLLELKLHAANVLLLVQHPALVDRFICYDGVGHTIALLEYVIMKVRVEHTQDPGVVVPVVIGLHQLAKNSVKGLSLLQQAIFQINNHTSAEIAQTTPLSELPMSPPPLVKGCLQQTLCTFMTSTNTDLKRCVSEFLFTLCRHNGTRSLSSYPWCQDL
ncbi:hypothetical protein, variant 2 [Aphanomyces astaci]|uniref:Uncharacterized protein n=1 Tax=Aphanomyces astaci TaxID=112090 RepID=W4G106_APHAT|nr:hypothetical protein, variant 2 [Aphanomyces astaci]ETV72719.1 hypothetical protein, variant 2 [Aphanomyces astaci]|eukprot:XP_009837951.1 hypothetical protein, variant 2 [Aphanomyces astaci]